jgi:hypothetical protein
MLLYNLISYETKKILSVAFFNMVFREQHHSLKISNGCGRLDILKNIIENAVNSKTIRPLVAA